MIKINKEKIKKLAFIFIYLWLITGCCFYNTNQLQHLRSYGYSDTSVVKKINNSTIALVREVKHRRTNVTMHTAYCSGVWINKKIILTAFHCIERTGASDKETINYLLGQPIKEKNLIGRTVKFVTSQDAYSNSMSPKLGFKNVKISKILAVNRNYDLALLKVDGIIESHVVSSISKKHLTQGMPIHVMGHTAGLTYTYSRGFLASERTLKTINGNKSIKILQISATIWRGNSGGGAFDENGELVGICSFILNSVNTVAFFIHRDAIIEFIHKSES